MNALCSTIFFVYINLVHSSEETSFLTTFHGLYFSHHYTHITAYQPYARVPITHILHITTHAGPYDLLSFALCCIAKVAYVQVIHLSFWWIIAMSLCLDTSFVDQGLFKSTCVSIDGQTKFYKSAQKLKKNFNSNFIFRNFKITSNILGISKSQEYLRKK